MDETVRLHQQGSQIISQSIGRNRRTQRGDRFQEARDVELLDDGAAVQVRRQQAMERAQVQQGFELAVGVFEIAHHLRLRPRPWRLRLTGIAASASPNCCSISCRRLASMLE
jgi:hypothetical protein